jgi:hypothetical protein
MAAWSQNHLWLGQQNPHKTTQFDGSLQISRWPNTVKGYTSVTRERQSVWKRLAKLFAQRHKDGAPARSAFLQQQRPSLGATRQFEIGFAESTVSSCLRAKQKSLRSQP